MLGRRVVQTAKALVVIVLVLMILLLLALALDLLEVLWAIRILARAAVVALSMLTVVVLSDGLGVIGSLHSVRLGRGR